MRFDPDVHHRRSIRLRGYDYSQAGLYFITICTYERLPLFGDVNDGGMQLSAAGKIASREWGNIAEMRPNIALGEFIVMPNHLHGIIAIKSTVRAHCMRPFPIGHAPSTMEFTPPKTGRMQCAPTVGDIVRGYKSAVTKHAKQLREYLGGPVWQRNYYEHIIRNETAHLKIAEYVRNNPSLWQDDTYYPA